MGITSSQAALLNKMNQIAKKVGLGTLIQGLTGSHYVVAAGEFTTAGGDANESITVSGALASDIVLVTLHTAGSTPRTVVTAQAGADSIAVVMSGDPSTDHVLSYVLLRAVA